MLPLDPLDLMQPGHPPIGSSSILSGNLQREELYLCSQTLRCLAAVILVVVGVKLNFLSAPTAEAVSLSIKSVGVDVSQLHQNVKNLPVEKFHDMSVVFPGRD